MKKATTRFSVNVQGGSEDELYFTAEPPTYEAEVIQGSVPIECVNYCVFFPQNGYPRGHKLRVPLERIVWISEETDAE